MIDAKRWSAVTAGAGLVLGMAVYGCSTETVDDSSSSSSSGGSSSGATSSSGSSGSTGSSSSSSSGSAGACTALTLGAFELYEDEDGAYEGSYIATVSPGGEEDYASIEIVNSGATGTFDLSQAPNDNYGTCTQCVSVQIGDKFYYPSAGTLVIDEGSTPDVSKLSGKLTNLKLVEVTIDEETYVSTPVDGGECTTVASADIDVDVVLEEVDGGDDDGGDDDSTDGG